MMTSSEQWYLNWENEISIEHLSSLNSQSIVEILKCFDDFIKEHTNDLHFKVLNAHPGHGKTTALKVFIKRIIQQNYGVGGLIVLREKELMKQVKDFVPEENLFGVLYVDGDNYQKVKGYISKYQFVIISHQRLKQLAVNQDHNPNEIELFLKWKDQKRVIIIDEAPSFVDSAVFELDNGLKWLDPCFKVADHVFFSEKRIMIRSIIQILLAKELIENKGKLTNALKQNLDSPSYTEVLHDFFRVMDPLIDGIQNQDSLNMYRWFKELFYQEQVGYLDPGSYGKSFSNHKKIICSRRIDYRRLDCPILILDGSSKYTPLIYNQEYEILGLPNYTRYERMTINHRRINTSADKRRLKSTHELVAYDIQAIWKEGLRPFPLMPKSEISQYQRLKVISNEEYEQFFQPDEDDKLPLNLLNTVGKNYLANEKSLYLTSLPSRDPIFYKTIAISLYGDSEETLNLSTDIRDKKQRDKWFVDQRIEEIYRECLLSELFQIVHRSNIRDLSAPVEDEVHIFIATSLNHVIDAFIKMFETSVKNNRSEVEQSNKFRQQLEKKVASLANSIKKEGIILPKPVGSIADDYALKNLINKNWKNAERRSEILDALNRYGLHISERKSGKVIEYIRDSVEKEASTI
jgi:hypothetical protein